MTVIFKVGETKLNSVDNVRAKCTINHETHAIVEPYYGQYQHLTFDVAEMLVASSGVVKHEKAWRLMIKAIAPVVGLKVKRIETPKPKLPTKKERKKFKKLLAKA